MALSSHGHFDGGGIGAKVCKPRFVLQEVVWAARSVECRTRSLESHMVVRVTLRSNQNCLLQCRQVGVLASRAVDAYSSAGTSLMVLGKQ